METYTHEDVLQTVTYDSNLPLPFRVLEARKLGTPPFPSYQQSIVPPP